MTSEREHVTPYIRKVSSNRKENLVYKSNLSSERWTVDEPQDFEMVERILANLYSKNRSFSMEDVLTLKKNQPEIFQGNQQFQRNEGYLKSLAQDRLLKQKDKL